MSDGHHILRGKQITPNLVARLSFADFGAMVSRCTFWEKEDDDARDLIYIAIARQNGKKAAERFFPLLGWEVVVLQDKDRLTVKLEGFNEFADLSPGQASHWVLEQLAPFMVEGCQVVVNVYDPNNLDHVIRWVVRAGGLVEQVIDTITWKDKPAKGPKLKTQKSSS